MSSEEEIKQKYQKVIKWLLNNVNPELGGIQEILSKLSEISNAGKKEELFSPPADLSDVLKQTEEVEQQINTITKKLLPNYNSPSKKDGDDAEYPSDDKFEKLFMRLLPKIDRSLSAIEEATFAINENISHIQLEPIPAAIKNQTPMQRQVRFVDKAKRIHNNLKMLEESLSFQLKEVLNETKPKLLYTAPDWSVPPHNKYFFQVLDGTVVLKHLCIHKVGHYLIGRLPICDIIIDDVTCSRQHAVIQFRPGDPNLVTGERDDEVYIYDLGSTSGTYVNGTGLQATAYYPLFPGDCIQFGQYPFVFLLHDGIDLPTPTTFDAPHLEAVNNADDAGLAKSIDKCGSGNEIISGAIGNGNVNGSGLPHSASVSSAISDLESAIKQTHLNGIQEIKDQLFAIDVHAGGNQISNQRPIPKAEIKQRAGSFDNLNSNNNNKPGEVMMPSSVSSSAIYAQSNNNNNNDNQLMMMIDSNNNNNNDGRCKSNTFSSFDPHSDDFDKDLYKRMMIEAYEQQQRENAEVLRKKKEREAQGLPPIVEIPYVPEPRHSRSGSSSSSKVDKKKKWWLLK